MPARLSQINDPTITASQGEDVTALYQGLVQMFQDPKALSFPGQYGNNDFNSSVEPMWLNRAFDRYVLENADLETELAAAETFAKAYRDCAAAIPEADPEQLLNDDAANAYYKQFADCAIKIDPSMKSQFSSFYPAS